MVVLGQHRVVDRLRKSLPAATAAAAPPADQPSA
jgi:hypothetical protein